MTRRGMMSWCLAVALLGAATATVAQDDLDWLLEGGETPPDSRPAPAASPAPAAQDPADSPNASDEAATAPAESTDVIAVADDTAAADELAPTAPRSRFVEEIVVTAQKREQNLQDVPVSVQVFSGELLDALGVTDQTDLQRITPGLNVTTQVSYVMTFLRGIGTDATIAAEPSVATYIDGVYYPFASNLAQNFGAVDRIEVLKGPQGTLFGRNATGGAIAIYTEEPDLDGGLRGELLTNFSSFDTQLYRAHVNLPLTEWFGLNATALTSRTDGYYDATYGTPPEPMPGDEMTGYRIKARLRPFDALDLRLAMFRFEQESYNGSVAFTSEPSSLGLLITPQPGYEGSVDSRPYNITDDNTVYYGSVVWHAPWLDIKLFGSDQRMDTAGLRDFDGSRLPISTFVTPSQYIDAQSLELQLLSNGEAGPDWLEWIVGAYYFRSTMGFGALDFYLAGVDLPNGTLAGIALPDPLVDILRLIPGAVLPTGAINMTGLIGTDSRALFTQATFALADWFSLTLGGRYQVEERYIVESTVGLGTADGGQVQLFDNSDRSVDSDGNPYPARDEQKDFSPKVTLEFRPFANGETLLFVSWQQAVKAATYNTIAIYTQPNYVAPEEIEAFEVGLKTSMFDGLARFNAAAFHYDVENLQTYYLSLFAGGVISFQNAGRARIVGADIDGLVQLFPSLIDNLTLSGGAAWLDTEYREFDGASGFNENGTFVSDQDYSGNQLIRTPQLTATLSLSKTWEIPGGALEAVFDAYYTEDFYYEASNREASKQESYWLLGARLSYLFERWDLRVTGGVRNLTDEFYTAGFFATDFGVQPTLAPPRSYFAQLIWNF
ncbi:TonB-dependent receptor [Sinimarinibacterium thermocellulolyticum]